MRLSRLFRMVRLLCLGWDSRLCWTANTAWNPRRMVPELLILVKAGDDRDENANAGHRMLILPVEGHRCCNALCGLYFAFVGHRFVHIWHWIYPVAQRWGWGAPTNIVCLESKIKNDKHFFHFFPTHETSGEHCEHVGCLKFQTLNMANHGLRSFWTLSWEVVTLASPTSQATCHALFIIFPRASFSDLLSP